MITERDREEFPGLEADIGEDPARFLDRPLFHADEHSSSPGQFIQARIRGISRLEVCRAWIAVERRLERGPRDRIIELLEDRETEIQQREPSPGRRDIPDRETQVFAVDQNGDRIPWDQHERDRVSSVSALADRARARADGGSDRDL